MYKYKKVLILKKKKKTIISYIQKLFNKVDLNILFFFFLQIWKTQTLRTCAEEHAVSRLAPRCPSHAFSPLSLDREQWHP